MFRETIGSLYQPDFGRTGMVASFCFVGLAIWSAAHLQQEKKYFPTRKVLPTVDFVADQELSWE